MRIFRMIDRRWGSAPALMSAVVVLLSGCATTPVSPSRAGRVPADRLLAFQERTADRTATIVVTRDRGMLGSGCYSSFFLNGVHAGRFDVGETATFHVPPGETLLRNGVDLEGRALCGFGAKDFWTQRETILRAGETKYFRLSLDASGKPDIQRADP
jgi:hypothetical protein